MFNQRHYIKKLLSDSTIINLKDKEQRKPNFLNVSATDRPADRVPKKSISSEDVPKVACGAISLGHLYCYVT